MTPTTTSERTQRRDKHEREAATVSMLELARGLQQLARDYPDCADILNVAMVQVRWRSAATRERDQAILRCLDSSPMTVDELCEEIIFFPGREAYRRMRPAITRELDRLISQGAVIATDRDGNPLKVRGDGKPTRTPYYEVANGQTPTGVGEQARDQVAGPSQTSSRHG